MGTFSRQEFWEMLFMNWLLPLPFVYLPRYYSVLVLLMSTPRRSIG
jgi:hypothetical protein